MLQYNSVILLGQVEYAPIDRAVDYESHFDLRRELMAHNPPQGVNATAVPGLFSYYYEADIPISCRCGSISVSFILNGCKSVSIGASPIFYNAGEGLLCGVEVPSTFRALGASPQNPFLAVTLNLDRSILLELAAELPHRPREQASAEAVFVFMPEEDLVVDFLRLVRLLDTPELIGLRAPWIIRDIHSLLLTGPTAARILPLLEESAPAGTVVQAISWLRSHYSEQVLVEDLARMHGMSMSNFHRHFKSVTGLSPLQFQKRIRLYEAQHQMFSGNTQVAQAAYNVGYESPTQFVREYKRLFGDSALRDVKRRRQVGTLASETCIADLCPTPSIETAA